MGTGQKQESGLHRDVRCQGSGKALEAWDGEQELRIGARKPRGFVN